MATTSSNRRRTPSPLPTDGPGRGSMEEVWHRLCSRVHDLSIHKEEGHDKNRSSDRRILPVLLDTLQSLAYYQYYPYYDHDEHITSYAPPPPTINRNPSSYTIRIHHTIEGSNIMFDHRARLSILHPYNVHHALIHHCTIIVPQQQQQQQVHHIKQHHVYAQPVI
ncbi:hypothetical protein FOZ60_002595 [Perkinsus olseni]|uniref:Uncharacterized protein n=1 Tax=Perkinsus olseni TaxID=32597 RepID=A0A7J6NYJ2_PEROL|nr:hypothetical protein FOZ60_002595 [Perkinsus olseni]